MRLAKISVAEANRALVTQTLQPASVQSRALLVALIDQETGERGYLLTGDNRFLQPYRLGRKEFAERLAELRSDFRGDPGMTAALNRVAAEAETWTRVGAMPEIRARQAAHVRRAQALVAAGRGKAAFDELRARVADLQSLIDARAFAAQQRDVGDLRTLRDVILFSRGTLVFLLVLGALLLRRWVLAPEQRLRSRMRAVADGRIDEEVLIDGPPEVAAVGRDAESMRRRIVAELEAARAATEALTQHSPVVSLLRSELTSHPRAEENGLEVAGMVLSAEGVLAGDWWEAFRRPDGTTALVIADVSGHGAEAGLVAFALKQRIMALLDSDLDLADAFELAARRPEDAERFLSCLVVVVGQRRAPAGPGRGPAAPRHRARARPDGSAHLRRHERLGGGHHAVRARRHAGRLHRRGARGPGGRRRGVRRDRPRRGDEADGPLVARRGGGRVPGGGAPLRGRRTTRRRDLRGADAGPRPGRCPAGLTGIRDRVPHPGRRWQSG